MAQQKQRKQRKHRTRRQRGGGFLDWIKEKLGMGQSAVGDPLGPPPAPPASASEAVNRAATNPINPTPTASPALHVPSQRGGKRRSRTKRRHNRKTQRKH